MKQKIISFGGPARRASPDRNRAAAAVNARRRRRRTGRRTLHYILILLAAAAIMMLLSLTVLFRIETIEVTGSTRYAAGELLDASGVQVGDNLFRVSARGVEKRLTEQFPYVQSVKLRRILPAKLVVEITQAKPLGAVETAGGYVVICRDGRVLEIGAQAVPDGVMIISGMYLYQPQVGRVLGQGYSKDEQKQAALEEEAFKMLSLLSDAIAQTEFDKITFVDFTDRLNMLLVYDNRVILELGTEAELPYKLRFAKNVLESELESSFTGTLDVSLAPTKKTVYALPGDITAELEKRRAAVAAQQEEPDSGAESASSEPVDPSLAVVPGTAPASSQMENASSGADEQSQASSAVDDFLAVIPGTAPSAVEESADSSSFASKSEE